MKYFKTKGERIYLAISIIYIFWIDIKILFSDPLDEDTNYFSIIMALIFMSAIPFVLFFIYKLIFKNEERQNIISNKNKKIFARELLMIILTSVICLIAFFIGNQLDKKRDNEIEKIEIEAINCDRQIENYIINFRKIPKVDSLYKLQMRFYIAYCESLKNDTLDKGNYFFWINVRNSIKDSTFKFTYASDEIIDKIEQQRWQNDTWQILYNQYNKRIENDHNNKDPLKILFDYKLEFEIFALNNEYEKYLSSSDWKVYQDLRTKKSHLEQSKSQNEEFKYEHNDTNYLSIAFAYCLIILFGLRYLFYLIKWSFAILKSKTD